MFGRSVNFLVAWSGSFFVGWLVVWLVGQSFSWSVVLVGSVVQSIGWLVAWSNSFFVGWLVVWFFVSDRRKRKSFSVARQPRVLKLEGTSS